ncbi:hypothetical protein OIN60_11560 [Paenibacillus sp. P96]|uniref:Uncharacterized protein n=1 Tax=Paenibacillus zeirhizosphaerae TaxID=2987519 RepID=A0ABT9FSA3_9BACL|nr:hypothetical protein [Paenibacillus sp. P96]MDP4097406.1 hypothetical protein [Paenibacillus sp. P96]
MRIRLFLQLREQLAEAVHVLLVAIASVRFDDFEVAFAFELLPERQPRVVAQILEQRRNGETRIRFM